MLGWIITGTDTGVGKTWATLGLLHALRARGYSVRGMKPIASGALPDVDGRLRNDDALAIQALSDASPDYEQVNPYVFEPPIAPHLAAAELGLTIDLNPTLDHARILARPVDYLLVEGVGGWCVPLAPGQRFSDLSRLLGLPVLLVVGLRLGCLNHAILTAERILDDGCRLDGWIGMTLDADMLRLTENLKTLEAELPAPCLGQVPFLKVCDPAGIAAALDLRTLVG